MKNILRMLSLFTCLSVLFFWTAPSRSADIIEQIQKRGYLLWGSDAEGGAPYIFPDPKDPSKLIGFEVDLAEEIAGELGVHAKQAQNAWDSLRRDLETIRKVRLRVGMVFQQFNLFPHMTVIENIIEAPVQVLGADRIRTIENALVNLSLPCT